MPDLTLYEEDRTYVIEKFHDGHFDCIEVIQEVVQRDFFRYVVKGDLLQRLADSYPSPRTKPEVPTWFYLVADRTTTKLPFSGRWSRTSSPRSVRA
jgi:hypothetical protein